MNRLHLRSTALMAAAFGTALAWQGTPALAQQTEIDALRQQLAAMQERLDKLEAAQKEAQSAAKTATATSATANAANVTSNSKVPVVVSGLLQVNSLNFLNETVGNNGVSSRDTFRLRRGEIRLTIPSVISRLAATVMFDPAKTTALRGNSATGAIRERDNILQEIQLSYQLTKGAKNAHFLDVGQFKIPVGYESTLVGSSALPLIERSLIFSQRDPFDGGYGDVRDTGIQLRGSVSAFDYRLGVFNGLGDRQNGLSLSDHKAVLGLISYRGIKNLMVGISGGTGNTGVQTFFTDAAGVTTTLVSRDDRSLFNAFAVYKAGKWTLQSEFLHGHATPIAVGTGTIAGRDIRGYYTHIGYLFTPKIEGVFRYDTLNTNRAVAEAQVTDAIVGLNYYIRGNNAKFQANLIKRSGGDNAPTSTNPSNNLRTDRLELRTGIQAAF